jgi:hypothetical protein
MLIIESNRNGKRKWEVPSAVEYPSDVMLNLFQHLLIATRDVVIGGVGGGDSDEKGHPG